MDDALATIPHTISLSIFSLSFYVCISFFLCLYLFLSLSIILSLSFAVSLVSVSFFHVCVLFFFPSFYFLGLCFSLLSLSIIVCIFSPCDKLDHPLHPHPPFLLIMCGTYSQNPLYANVVIS